MKFRIEECTKDNVRKNFERTIFAEVKSPLDLATEVICSNATFLLLIEKLNEDNLLPYNNDYYTYPGSNCKIIIE